MVIGGIPTSIIIGVGTFKLLNEYVQMYRNPILLHSNSFERLRLNKNVIINSLPTEIDLEHAKAKFYNNDVIVACGGGSVIDVAKLLAFDKQVPLIAVPTIFGSGSEVTKYAVLWRENKKLSYNDVKLYPSLSIIDPSLHVTVPFKQKAYSALDSLCHAYEAVYHKNANIVVSTLSMMAIETFSSCLKYLGSDELNHCEQFATASLFSGAAMSLISTSVCHSLSYPLTTKFGVPHGLAAYVHLPWFFKKCSNSSDKVSVDESILQNLGIKYKLSEYGVKKEDLEWIVDEAFSYEKMDRAIVSFTRKETLEHMEEIL